MAKMPDVKVKVVWEDTPLTRAIAEEAVANERQRIYQAVKAQLPWAEVEGEPWVKQSAVLLIVAGES